MENLSTKTSDTLPDEAWMDSFDKLLNQRTELRKLNIIKHNVRASFNMNSSYENSGCTPSDDKKIKNIEKNKEANTKMLFLEVPKPYQKFYENNNAAEMSTPVSNILFGCPLSPISTWKFEYFEPNNTKYTNGNPKKLIRNTINKDAKTLKQVCDKIVPQINLNKKHSSNAAMSTPIARDSKKTTYRPDSRHVHFDTIEAKENNIKISMPLQPGKWRKSLHLFRRSQQQLQSEKNDKIKNFTRNKIYKNSLPIIPKGGKRKSTVIVPGKENNLTQTRYSSNNNQFRRELLRRCNQRRPLPFTDIYSEEYLQYCSKIGEGAFGEVFLYRNDKEQSDNIVFKIIPIEGQRLINGEVQKTYEDILPEVVITMELCALDNEQRAKDMTSGFVKIKFARCIKGEYPAQLIKLWEEYDKVNESENEHPKCFTHAQYYVVLELAYGGQDLESFVFKTAEQSYYALQQIILTLAVGESVYQFEHRDLHWGNILLLNTKENSISYKLENTVLTIPTKGVKATIIDYTLSRMTYNNCSLYNDISTDEELFTATGDYQFDIYRMMRDILKNKWEIFEPKTNIYWISYLISKMIDNVSYKQKHFKSHLKYMKKLQELRETILSYNSCLEYAKILFLK